MDCVRSAKTALHLKQVYLELYYMFFTAGITVFTVHLLDLFNHDQIMLEVVSFISLLLIGIGYISRSVSVQTYCLRLVSVMIGLLITPMIDSSDTMSLSLAFLETSVIFIICSLFAVQICNRSILFFFTVLIVNVPLFFINSMYVFDNELAALGIVIFTIYVIIDTQIMIERAQVMTYEELNSRVVIDALNLFLDFVNIFVRLLHFLNKDKKKN